MSRKTHKKSSQSEAKPDWRRYERAMFNDLYYAYRSPRFIVLPDHRELEGQITGGKRQIDVVVFALENTKRPLIAVESKFYTRKLNVKDVEAFIGMQQDLGSQYAIMVAPQGFTDMAYRRVRGTNIELVTLPTIEAERLNWREVARADFTIDETFHPEMGDAIHVFDTTHDYKDLTAIMEELPFEEWETLSSIYRKVDAQKCKRTLEGLAMFHDDADWVFNSVRLLNDFGWLAQPFVRDLITAKRGDNDLWEYLNEVGYLAEI